MNGEKIAYGVLLDNSSAPHFMSKTFTCALSHKLPTVNPLQDYVCITLHKH